MTPEHYDTYAAARSHLAALARTSPDETFGACHELLLELDALHPEIAVTETSLRPYPTRTTAWRQAEESIGALANHGVDSLRLALLLESLERTRYAEHPRPHTPTRHER